MHGRRPHLNVLRLCGVRQDSEVAAFLKALHGFLSARILVMVGVRRMMV